MFRHPYIISQQSHVSRPVPIYRPVVDCSASQIISFISIIAAGADLSAGPRKSPKRMEIPQLLFLPCSTAII